jgi:3-oxoacyl-[acyl-carrier protein] reductase
MNNMLDLRLKNKVVLITGANHGIGEAAALTFAKQGCKVFVAYYLPTTKYSDEELKRAKEMAVGNDILYRANQQQSGLKVADKIKNQGGQAYAYEADLSKPENITQLFDVCEKKLGSVDILVNNHTLCNLETFDPKLATNNEGGIKLVSPKGIDKHFAVNTRSYVLMMSEYLRRRIAKKARWGRIINTSTDAADAHTANISYAASKHAIESYSRSAAAEMGKYGITVNIVSPGPTQTGYLTPEQEKILASKTPLARIGQPKDIADIMILLASEQARWITGQLIYAGGGIKMHL